MKYFFILSLLLAGSAFAETVSMTVEGMTCESCVKTITKKLKTFSEVKNVEIYLKEKRVKVEFNSGESLDNNKLKETILNAGYNVTEIKRG